MRRAAVEDGVRRFTVTVAHDVTEEGPVAWRKHFADSPAFFYGGEWEARLSKRAGGGSGNSGDRAPIQAHRIALGG